MTTIVFNSGILTIATASWAATAINVKNSETKVRVFPTGAPVSRCDLDMTMSEFLAMIAEGGKIIDLRGLQL